MGIGDFIEVSRAYFKEKFPSCLKRINYNISLGSDADSGDGTISILVFLEADGQSLVDQYLVFRSLVLEMKEIEEVERCMIYR